MMTSISILRTEWGLRVVSRPYVSGPTAKMRSILFEYFSRMLNNWGTLFSLISISSRFIICVFKRPSRPYCWMLFSKKLNYFNFGKNSVDEFILALIMERMWVSVRLFEFRESCRIYSVDTCPKTANYFSEK